MQIWILARDRKRIMKEEVTINREISRITESRLKAGDISEMEAIAIRLAATQVEENYLRFLKEASIETIRLKTLLGMVSDNREIELVADNPQLKQPLSEEELLTIAYAARPDIRAAEIAIEAAGKKLDWERSKIWSLTATLDANEEGKAGFEMGPGIQTTLPLFNRNDGARSRAMAEMEQAAKEYLAARQQIASEVRQAYQNYISAVDIFALLRERTIPDAAQASEQGEKAYLLGDISYLAYLDFKQQLIDARLREAEALASIKKAEAELRYSVGFKPTAKE